MASNHIKKVAIVGVTGQVGKYIVAELLKKGTFEVTGLSRAGSNHELPDGVKSVVIDYDQTETIVSALKGQDAFIITMSVRAPPDQQAKLVEAAAKAGVPWVLPNEFGGNTDEQASKDTGLGPGKAAVRKQIEDLGVSSWLGIVNGFWYEYSLSGPGPYGFDINEKEAIFFDEGTRKLPTTTFPQVGRGVANLLSLPISAEDSSTTTLTSFRNRFVYISSFTLNQQDMFASLKRVTKTTDADWNISTVASKDRYEKAKKDLAGGNQRGFIYMLYTRYFMPNEDGSPAVSYRSDNKALGLPEEDLDEWTAKAVELAESGYWLKMFSARHS